MIRGVGGLLLLLLAVISFFSGLWFAGLFLLLLLFLPAFIPGKRHGVENPVNIHVRVVLDDEGRFQRVETDDPHYEIVSKVPGEQ